MNRADTIKALADVLGDYIPESRAVLLETAEKLLGVYEAYASNDRPRMAPRHTSGTS